MKWIIACILTLLPSLLLCFVGLTMLVSLDILSLLAKMWNKSFDKNQLLIFFIALFILIWRQYQYTWSHVCKHKTIQTWSIFLFDTASHYKYFHLIVLKRGISELLLLRNFIGWPHHSLTQYSMSNTWKATHFSMIWSILTFIQSKFY